MPEISGLYLQGEEEGGEERVKRERVQGKGNQYISGFCCFVTKNRWLF